MTREYIIQECWEWLYWHSGEHLYKDEQGVRHFDSLGAANACKKHLEDVAKGEQYIQLYQIKALVSSYLELSDASLHLSFEQAEGFERVKDALKKAVRDENVSVGEAYLTDWYIHSIDNEKDPVWTEKHIQELCNDFILIPKR